MATKRSKSSSNRRTKAKAKPSRTLPQPNAFSPPSNSAVEINEKWKQLVAGTGVTVDVGTFARAQVCHPDENEHCPPGTVSWCDPSKPFQQRQDPAPGNGPAPVKGNNLPFFIYSRAYERCLLFQDVDADPQQCKDRLCRAVVREQRFLTSSVRLVRYST